MAPSPTPAVRSWPWLAAAGLFTVVLLATLGVAPTLWYKVLPYLEPFLKPIAVGGGFLITVALLSKAWFAGPRNTVPALGLVVLGTAIVALLLVTFFADATPAGKLHVIEYAVLGYMALNALNVNRFSDRVLRYGMVALLAVGVLDEGIQYLLPNRYFDLMDIAGNWIATGLGLLFWAACSRHSPWRRQNTG